MEISRTGKGVERMTAKRFTECEYYNDDDCLNVNVIGYCSNPVRHKKIKGIALLHCQGSACELDTKDKLEDLE